MPADSHVPLNIPINRTIKNLFKASLAAIGAAMLLCSCASTPLGPSVQVPPKPKAPVFQQGQDVRRQDARSQMADQADAANGSATGTAILSTALGAATSWHGHAAGAGAAFGTVTGTAIGAAGSQGKQV